MVVSMEVKNKIIIYGAIVAIILIIIIYSVVLVYQDHQDKKYLVMEKKVCEAALNCYNHHECPTTEIKLQELYDLNYLDQVVNPQNKEYLNPDTLIIINPEDNTASLEIG